MSITGDSMLSEDDLEANCQALMRAEAVKADKAVYEATIRYMKKKAGQINSVADLRHKAENISEMANSSWRDFDNEHGESGSD